MTKFEVRVREAKKAKHVAGQPHDEDAFNQYLHWFLSNYRVQVLPDAFLEDVLEEPLEFDQLATQEYNWLTRQGHQASHGQLLSFVVRKSLSNNPFVTPTY